MSTTALNLHDFPMTRSQSLHCADEESEAQRGPTGEGGNVLNVKGHWTSLPSGHRQQQLTGHITR